MYPEFNCNNVNIVRGSKRRREVEDNISACNDEIERLLNTPKKKKLHTTSQYIYDNLFLVKEPNILKNSDKL